MRHHAPGLRRAVTGAVAVAAVASLGAWAQAGHSGSRRAHTETITTASTGHARHPRTVRNPYSPAYHHPYRHGVVPTRSRLTKMHRWARAHPALAAAANDLNFGGGVDGIGVTTGHEKVYLVFWGSQWGTASTNGSGDTTFSNDSSGAAPYLQEMFKGLGTSNELWSGVMTQYCEGVATGAQTCPSSNTSHVAYPTGGALAGVWADTGSAEPSAASAAQLGTLAVQAASHFGNTTAASNRDAQYDIVSAPGTNPDNYKTGGFCAWHDWNGDVGVSSGVGDIAFTNMPYVSDVGSSCGANFVNSGSTGIRDGFSIVNGHEYAETVTDQNPAGGWTDSSGQENADKCAWVAPGTTGGAFNLTTATGTFAMQGTWGNDGNSGAGACQDSHPIVTNGGGGNTVTVTNPGNQTGTAGTPASLQITATDPASGQTLTYTATGLPTGLSINSATGLISGTPTTANTYNVTVKATDTTGANGSASFTWTISQPAGGGIVNGGFETGTFAKWTTSGAATSIVSIGQRSGNYAARAGAPAPTKGSSSIAQTFTVPAGKHALSVWYNVTCPDSVRRDWATVTLRNNATRSTTRILPPTCAVSSGWRQVTATVQPGRSYTLTLTSQDDNRPGNATYTLFDDVTLS
jgi:hypothetical protein